MTLATLTALRGIGLLITNGATISITNDNFTNFSRGNFLWRAESFLDGAGGGDSRLCVPASEPLGSLSLRHRLQYGGRAAFRRQHQVR